jgi:hypothetical protein
MGEKGETMNWTVEAVELGAITRQKIQPNYGFVEQAIPGGTAYLIQGGSSPGYFLVASEASLTPGFVVELVLPELAVQDKYAALANEMSRRSFGVMWFDSEDRDACDLAWRLGLSVRSGPPLFQWNGLRQDVSLEGFQIAVAERSEQARVVELLTAPPPDAGGQTREAVIENLEGRCVVVLKKDQDILGAAVLSPLPGPYVALSSVVMDTFSNLPPSEHEAAHRELELLFMNLLGSEAAQKNVRLVYSMARQTPMGYLEALRLRMTLVKQSFMANLTGLPPAFSPRLPAGARAVI